jgi:CBS domain-containing protein
MNEWHIGSVLVMDGDQLLGIFTERDVMRRVVAAHRDPEMTRLEEVMTSPVACAAPHTTLDELRLVMRVQRIRHIPVARNDQVIGIISIGDLNKAEHDVQEQTILYLAQYMSVL